MYNEEMYFAFNIIYAELLNARTEYLVKFIQTNMEHKTLLWDMTNYITEMALDKGHLPIVYHMWKMYERDPVRSKLMINTRARYKTLMEALRTKIPLHVVKSNE